MTIDQLRDAHRANPFRPFTIHLADGRKFTIPHRDFLSHSPTGRTLIVYQPNDAFSIIDLLLVTELEVHGASQEQPQSP
jgi:hypothetical protein